MKVKEMKTILSTTKFDNVECNFKLKSKGPQAPEWFKQWFTEFYSVLDTRLSKIESFIVEQKQFNNYVLEQFKKHGWIN